MSDGCGAPGKSYRCLLCVKYAFSEGRCAIGVSTGGGGMGGGTRIGGRGRERGLSKSG